MSSNYWTRYRQRTITRRRALGASLATTAGVAAVGLVGCGDDDDDTDSSPTSTTGSSPGTTPTGASSPAAEEPKSGGRWTTASVSDIAALDPYASASVAVKQYGAHVYSRLFTVESQKPDETGVVPIEIVGDAADSFEVSADGTEYTVTLKDNVMFHPPISRPMDAEDVVFSWERFTGRLAGSTPAPNADRLSIIANVQAVDERTVVFNLASPFGPFPDLLADATTLLIMPKETGEAFDPAQAMVGSGPWMFGEHVPGGSLTLRRNPQWHFGPDRPYLDEVQLVIVGDQATILNQFMAGNIDSTGATGLAIADIVAAIPDVQLHQRETTGLVGYFAFSSVTDPSNPAPWTDVRVRRAMSMALNRDLMVEASYNLDLYSEAGFDFTVPWQGSLPRSFSQFVLHPADDPEIAEWFTYDPDAAQALLNEAGGGFSIDVFDATAFYGPDHNTLTELAMASWNEIGIETNLVVQDYRSQWIPDIYQRANFSGERGVAHIGQAGINEPGAFLRSSLHPDATLNHGSVDVPELTAALDEYFTQTDLDTRIQTLMDIQKRALTEMYYIPSQWGAFPSPTAVQPNVRGYGDYVSFGYGAWGQDNTYYWKA